VGLARFYKQALARTGDYVRMLGSFIGPSAVRVMREPVKPADAARIWAAQETLACPGRVRLDADHLHTADSESWE
jgi:hypothetical protein